MGRRKCDQSAKNLKLLQTVKPQPTLIGKHLKFCLSKFCLSGTMFVGLATTKTDALQTCFACHKQKMFLKRLKKHEQAKCACQAMFVVVAKRASMFDEQSWKCLADNVCPFRQGFGRCSGPSKNSEPSRK